MKPQDDPWHEGFKAGGLLGCRCPYPPGSKAADDWEEGWAEGVLKWAGENYRDRPEPPAWQRLLTKLRLR